jgi:hypothetical protein
MGLPPNVKALIAKQLQPILPDLPLWLDPPELSPNRLDLIQSDPYLALSLKCFWQESLLPDFETLENFFVCCSSFMLLLSSGFYYYI